MLGGYQVFKKPNGSKFFEGLQDLPWFFIFILN
jgi:hypothetical protein